MSLDWRRKPQIEEPRRHRWWHEPDTIAMVVALALGIAAIALSVLLLREAP